MKKVLTCIGIKIQRKIGPHIVTYAPRERKIETTLENSMQLSEECTLTLYVCLVFPQSLEALCNPILNKPKPKVEPPKDEKKEAEGEANNQAAGAGDANQEKSNSEQPQPGSEQANSAADMDLD